MARRKRLPGTVGIEASARPFPDFDQERLDMIEAVRFPSFDESRIEALRTGLAVPAGLAAVARHLALDEGTLSGAGRIAEQLSTANRSVADALGPHMKGYEEARRRLDGVMGVFKSPDVEEARQRLAAIMGDLHSPEIEEAKQRLGAVMGEFSSVAEEAKRNLLNSQPASVAEEYLRSIESSPSSYEPPRFEVPRNPILDTNKHLATTNEKIDALIDVQAKQTGLVDALLAANLQSSAAQERAAKANLRLALVSISLAFMAVLAAFLGLIG